VVADPAPLRQITLNLIALDPSANAGAGDRLDRLS